MKTLFTFLLVPVIWVQSFGQQGLPDQFSLKDYAPQITHQDGANCFAYATVYVALTTQLAFANHLAPDESNSYSFGYVDAIVEHFGKRKMQKLCQQQWGGNSGDYEGLDFALYVLLHYGTVHFKSFPYTLDREAKAHFSPDMLNGQSDIKIADINELVTPDDYLHFDALFLKFKTAIAAGHPVICAIKEDATECDADFVNTPQLAIAPVSNHVINVIGYDGPRRMLLIKNNFDKNCTFEIPLEKFCKALSWAYTIVLPK